MSIASYEGGGRHIHLGITITNEEYFAIAVDVFPVPNNPGPSAAVVVGITASAIAKTTRLHQEATQVYRTYHNMDQAIKKLIIEYFDDTYLNALSDETHSAPNSHRRQKTPVIRAVKPQTPHVMVRQSDIQQYNLSHDTMS
jgi:hypothetical protein